MTCTNNYIRGLRLAEISDGTATRQYTFNAHGDVTGLVDTTTGAVTDYTYDAYGNEDNASATDTNPFRYSGEYYDTETGFIYLRARYYDPSIGRFTAEDPIRDGTNWYVYCNNNPVMYVDPSGKALETAFDIASIGFSIADVVHNPKDGWAWAGLAGDIIDFIPFVTGVGETLKIIGTSKKAVAVANNADALVDSLKVLGKAQRIEIIKDGAVVLPYKSLRKLTKNTGLEAHHLIEKRFAKKLDLESNEILSVALDKETHQQITNAFRKELPYSTSRNPRNYSVQEIWNGIKKSIH